MNLFITKGARPIVRFRKAGWYEEISSGIGAGEASSSSTLAEVAQLACSFFGLHL